jgi:hypothetical protein
MSDRASRQPFDPTNAWEEAPGAGRALSVGIAVGVAVFFAGITAAFVAGGQGWGAAVGMGAFVALWGGIGFGFMFSGVIWATHAEEAAKRARREALASAQEHAEETSTEGTELAEGEVRSPRSSSDSAPLKVAS